MGAGGRRGGMLVGSEPARSNENLTPALFWMSPFPLEARSLGLTMGCATDGAAGLAPGRCAVTSGPWMPVRPRSAASSLGAQWLPQHHGRGVWEESSMAIRHFQRAGDKQKPKPQKPERDVSAESSLHLGPACPGGTLPLSPRLGPPLRHCP